VGVGEGGDLEIPVRRLDADEADEPALLLAHYAPAAAPPADPLAYLEESRRHQLPRSLSQVTAIVPHCPLTITRGSPRWNFVTRIEPCRPGGGVGHCHPFSEEQSARVNQVVALDAGELQLLREAAKNLEGSPRFMAEWVLRLWPTFPTEGRPTALLLVANALASMQDRN